MPLRVISIAAVLTILAWPNAEARSDRPMWDRYKQYFLSTDGRIVDHAQAKTSHSEGQGYGMLLAVRHDDRPAFEKIWQWTKNNLQIRADSLFAWHWGKRPNNEWQTLDYNNATDGDIVIAFALLQAADTWNISGFRDEALKIIRDIRKLLAVSERGRTFLLPGYFGFQRESGLLLNPSYLLFSAFRAFGKADEAKFWDAVRKDALFLIERSCFGSLGLPADWIELAGDAIKPAGGKAPYFGAEAVRVLLALASEEAHHYPKGVSLLLDQYRTSGRLPLWVDLEKNSLSLRPAIAGYYAIYGLAAKKLGDRLLARKLQSEAEEKLKTENDAYYSFSLFLLATTAEESGQD